MAVCVAFLSGCTPNRVRISGIMVDHGAVVVIASPCGGSQVDGVSVDTIAPEPDFKSWSIRMFGTQHPRTLRVFETPPGSVVQTHSLTKFDAGVTYLATVQTTKRDGGNDIGLRFTLADLSKLRDGQVWAEDAHGVGMIVSRSDFERMARESCA